MLNPKEHTAEFEKLIFNGPTQDEEFEDLVQDDNDINDVDFSSLSGQNFRKAFSAAKKKVTNLKKAKRASKKKPLSNHIPVQRHASINSEGKRKLANVIVPRDRTLIVEGVDRFITSNEMDWYKNIEMYKGEKLKQMLLTIDNTGSAVNTTIDLFDPSSRIDWLLANTQDVNDVVRVAGGVVRYSDILNNLLANPIMIVNAKFVIEGASLDSQLNQSMLIKNKNIEGWERVNPVAVSVKIDTMQKEKYVVCFNFSESLNRPFIADGMDVAQYTVLPGSSVTMCFYVKQHSLKRLLFPEAEKSKVLLP